MRNPIFMSKIRKSDAQRRTHRKNEPRKFRKNRFIFPGSDLDETWWKFLEFLGPICQLKLKELAIFDCKFGFLVKNCIYRHLGMSRILKFDEKHQNLWFWKNTKFWISFFCRFWLLFWSLGCLERSGRLVGKNSTKFRPNPATGVRAMTKKPNLSRFVFPNFSALTVWFGHFWPENRIPHEKLHI